MNNLDQEKKNSHFYFTWEKLGNVKEGRQQLGPDAPVIVYRLLQYSLKHILHERYGEEQAVEIFREAGFLAGSEFARNMLPLNEDFGEFSAALYKTLRELKMGILRIEQADLEKGEVLLDVYEDLDCSGLPVTNEVVCSYDEGFLAGVLEAYTGDKFQFREIYCWANGDRVCRFEGKRQDV